MAFVYSLIDIVIFGWLLLTVTLILKAKTYHLDFISIFIFIMTCVVYVYLLIVNTQRLIGAIVK